MRKGIIQYKRKYPWWLVNICIALVVFFPCMTYKVANVSALMSDIKQTLTPVDIPQFRHNLLDGHDPKLVKAIIQVESSNRKHIISNKGAVGLMQVMPSTARFLGLPHSVAELKNPQINQYVGCRILSYYRKKAKDDLWQALIWYSGGDSEYPVRIMKEYARRI